MWNNNNKLGFIFIILGLGLSLTTLVMWFAVIHPTPYRDSLAEIKKKYLSSEGAIVDHHGELLHLLRMNPKQRKLNWVSLSEISPLVEKYVVAIEDHRFYSHHGIDLYAVGRSLWHRLKKIKGGGRSEEGFSTITMQVASLLDSSLLPKLGHRTLAQKIKQIVVARQLERAFTKKELLEIYFNLVSFKGELVGLQATSEGLFAKIPSGLNAVESLILVSLIKNPNFHEASLLLRVNYWANIFHIEGDMTSLISTLFRHPYKIKSYQLLNPTFARSLLDQATKGYRGYVKTTLDRKLQLFVQSVLDEQVHKLKQMNVNEGAVLVVENKTGAMKAYVSAPSDSKNYFVDGVLARRQVGSVIKPFLYALALEKRYLTAVSVIDDNPLNIQIENRGTYRPSNFDHLFHGPVTLREALASSLNIPAVKVLNIVGVESFLQLLRDLHFRHILDDDFYGPSLALGSIDLTLHDMVGAFRVLANGGLDYFKQRIFSEGVAFIISDILADKKARTLTFGMTNPLNTKYWSAVKTGTSKDMRDNWCVGYSDQYTVGVWLGNFSGDSMWHISGIHGAAPIWLGVMDYLHQNNLSKQPRKPDDVIKKEIRNDGVISHLNAHFTDYFLSGTEQSELSFVKKDVIPKIIYPPAGATFAIDPDIPKEFQKMVFVANLSNPIFFLNGKKMKSPEWGLIEGKYHLQLKEKKGNVVDQLSFVVK